MKGSLLAAIALASLALSARAGDRREPRICPVGQTIVLLRPGVDPDQAAQLFAARYAGTVCRVYRRGVHGVTLRCTGPRVVKALSADPLVASVEPDVTVMALGEAGGDPTRVQVIPTGIRRIGADAGVTGKGGDERFPVGVAIVDTGIDLGHPDLHVVGQVSFVDGARTAADGQGHGTHCAGIVAARDNGFGVVGVAPGAPLYAVKVLDDDGSGALSDVVAGLDWVTAHADKIAVANLSLGVKGRSPALRAAIQAAVRAGVVVVAAAGNESADVFGEDGVFDTADDSIPAAFPEVMAVSALADSDGAAGGLGGSTRAGEDDTLATFSNFAAHAHKSPFVRSPGGAIDVAAPGVNILSCWKGGGYKTISGTSMAAPHVTGLVARYVAAHGRDVNGDGKVDEKDVYAIRQAIVDAAEPQSAWRPDGYTADKDGLHEGLASVEGRRFAPPAGPPLAGRPRPAPPLPPSPPAASAVSVIAIVAPAGRIEGPADAYVGVKNRGPSSAIFDLLLFDTDAGTGIGRRRVPSIAPGAQLTVTFPLVPYEYDPRHHLSAVVLPVRPAVAKPAVATREKPPRPPGCG